ncbi:hypothetical protein C0J52_26915 [Blattella germanica]|nr:hypothetical protein C0J52_26915 [Blattella germanica]
MDQIKEEIELKLERFSDVSLDVDGNSDDHFEHLLDDQQVKLEKQDMIYELKEGTSETKDKEFEFVSLACVKEEIDADSNSQDMIYELKEGTSETKDKEFEFVSVACVKEEIDADSNSQVRKSCLLVVCLIYSDLF